MPFYGIIRLGPGQIAWDESKSKWPPTPENSTIRKDNNKFHSMTRKYNRILAFQFSVIPYREFNNRGFIVAPKAAQLLYGKVDYDIMVDLPLSESWFIEDPF